MVSLIIVDYKSIEKTLEYLQEFFTHVVEAAEDQIHPIIVDNSENNAEILERLKRKTKETLSQVTISLEKEHVSVFKGRYLNHDLIYIATHENLGYARGNNLGADFARLYFQDEYYLFSNNDLKFPRKFSMEELLSPMKKNTTIAVVGPSIKTPEGEQQSPWKKTSVFSALFLNYFDLLLPKTVKITRWITSVEKTDHSKCCYWVSGSFMMVCAEAFQKTGGFDPHTFLYCEEMILSEKMLSQGYQTYYEKAIPVIHEHGQTVKSVFAAVEGIQISFESSIYYFRTYRNMSAVTEKLARAHFSIFKRLFLLKKSLLK